MYVASVAAGANPFSVTVDPSGRYAYVANETGNSVSQYVIGSDGALTSMATAAVVPGLFPTSVTVDPSGRYAYVANFNSNTVSQYMIGSDGSLSSMASATVAARAR